VLLIPGYGGGQESLQAVAQRLRQGGVAAEVVSIGDGTGDLAGYAAAVTARAGQLVAQGAPSVDLIGFSAGGVIARDAATRADGRALVRKVVTIGTPHDGTELTTLGALVGSCPTACQELTPGSDYLKQLPVANGVDRWLSMWSSSDEVIRPITSSELDGARWFALQDVCARQIAHNELMADPLTQATATAFLAEAPLPSSCTV